MGWMIGVQFPTGAEILHHQVQTGCADFLASYPVGTRGSFLRLKRPECETDCSTLYNVEVNLYEAAFKPPDILTDGLSF
jgi:hypothetical protein